jgi:hypothetical protein
VHGAACLRDQPRIMLVGTEINVKSVAQVCNRLCSVIIVVVQPGEVVFFFLGPPKSAGRPCNAVISELNWA